MKLIEVNSVTKEYARGFYALKNLTFSVEEGSFVSIVGPFGCGKTTILNLLGGITEDYIGNIKIRKESPAKARKTRKIGYVFQKPALLPWRNVIRNITLPLEISGIEKYEKAYDLLKIVKLEYAAKKMPHELSRGMQQLICIARSLILDPDVLLLDEPFCSIDEINRGKMQNRLLEIHKQTNKTTLLVTHSLNEAVYLSDQIIILTSRPAKVKRIIDIDFQERNEKVFFSEKFLNYLKIIKAELSNE